MKRKRRQRWIAMLMAVVMLASTMGSTGLAQSLQTESYAAQDHRSTRETTAEEIILPDRVKEWGEEYETAATQQEADALRTQDESKNLLITAKECTLSGLTDRSGSRTLHPVSYHTSAALFAENVFCLVRLVLCILLPSVPVSSENSCMGCCPPH